MKKAVELYGDSCRSAIWDSLEGAGNQALPGGQKGRGIDNLEKRMGKGAPQGAPCALSDLEQFEAAGLLRLHHHCGAVGKDLGHIVAQVGGVVANTNDGVRPYLVGMLHHVIEGFGTGLLA